MSQLKEYLKHACALKAIVLDIPKKKKFILIEIRASIIICTYRSYSVLYIPLKMFEYTKYTIQAYYAHIYYYYYMHTV